MDARNSASLSALVNSGVNVTISVTTEQLREAFLGWSKELIAALKPEREEEWLTIKEAADMLKVSYGTIRNCIKRGWIHPVKQGAVVRIRRSEIENFDKF